MSTTTEADPLVGVTLDELRSVIAKLQGLSEREQANMSVLVESYASLLGAISDKNATIAKLREVLFGAQTETKENVQRQVGKPPAPAAKEGAEAEGAEA
jgi:hypothetical protein